MTRDGFERRLLRLSVQVYRRGFFMPMWNLQEIVERRLMRELFRRWRLEREADQANARWRQETRT